MRSAAAGVDLERDDTTRAPSRLILEVLPGLTVDVPELVESLGLDAGEIFFHAGLTIIGRAVEVARETRWWSGLPERTRKQLAAECERGLRMIEFGERLQLAERDYFHGLRNGDQELEDELRARIAERKSA